MVHITAQFILAALTASLAFAAPVPSGPSSQQRPIPSGSRADSPIDLDSPMSEGGQSPPSDIAYIRPKQLDHTPDARREIASTFSEKKPPDFAGVIHGSGLRLSYDESFEPPTHSKNLPPGKPSPAKAKGKNRVSWTLSSDFVSVKPEDVMMYESLSDESETDSELSSGAEDSSPAAAASKTRSSKVQRAQRSSDRKSLMLNPVTPNLPPK